MGRDNLAIGTDFQVLKGLKCFSNFRKSGKARQNFEPIFDVTLKHVKSNDYMDILSLSSMIGTM